MKLFKAFWIVIRTILQLYATLIGVLGLVSIPELVAEPEIDGTLKYVVGFFRTSLYIFKHYMDFVVLCIMIATVMVAFFLEMPQERRKADYEQKKNNMISKKNSSKKRR